jgi:uncharacterized protein
VAERAAQENIAIRCGHKCSGDLGPAGDIVEYGDNTNALNALRAGQVHVLGGTVWLWARDESMDIVDVLVVDEAGQMQLANVIAASGAANSLVLLGDPQQLEQPQKGSHPDGTEVSALAHILQEQKVIPADRGIFLPETWRMAPPICGYCSEVFYESKLKPRAGLEAQRLAGTTIFDGSGLWRVDVEHEGNTNESPEEVEAVARIVETLLGTKAKWIDREGKEKRMSASDILVVAPYNRHVRRLGERLASRKVKVGTVDKFQGQEAPVVIYSMASSSPSDASRGMEFLYSLNRLNVATSRARCATILVASPKLYEPECRSPRQMKLANGLCRYAEMARVVPA